MGTFTACLTFDVDGMSGWIGTAKSNNPSTISRGEFTIIGTSRVLELLRRKSIRASFFVPGHTACAFPDLIRQIRDEGHEIGHHGWVHESPAEDDAAAERVAIERGLEALDRVAGIRPAGYRAPAADVSRHTLRLLKEFGFTYDSSFFASDFFPYYGRIGDRWGPAEPYHFGETIHLVEMALNTALNDFAAFETYPGLIPGYVPPRDLEGMWRDDFDFAVSECPDGHFMVRMHPQCIGRGSRIRMLERVIYHISGTAPATFQSVGTYIADWRARNPLDEWKKANPLRTSVNAITSI
jgi:peptidoglycan-N-acetylglucosamine deacetylase